MVKMINAYFGNEMWVSEDRVEEYKAAGHKPAAKVSAQPDKEPKEDKEPVKKAKSKK